LTRFRTENPLSQREVRDVAKIESQTLSGSEEEGRGQQKLFSLSQR